MRPHTIVALVVLTLLGALVGAAVGSFWPKSFVASATMGVGTRAPGEALEPGLWTAHRFESLVLEGFRVEAVHGTVVRRPPGVRPQNELVLDVYADSATTAVAAIETAYADIRKSHERLVEGVRAGVLFRELLAELRSRTASSPALRKVDALAEKSYEDADEVLQDAHPEPSTLGPIRVRSHPNRPFFALAGAGTFGMFGWFFLSWRLRNPGWRAGWGGALVSAAVFGSIAFVWAPRDSRTWYRTVLRVAVIDAEEYPFSAESMAERIRSDLRSKDGFEAVVHALRASDGSSSSFIEMRVASADAARSRAESDRVAREVVALGRAPFLADVAAREERVRSLFEEFRTVPSVIDLDSAMRAYNVIFDLVRSQYALSPGRTRAGEVVLAPRPVTQPIAPPWVWTLTGALSGLFVSFAFRIARSSRSGLDS